LNKILRRRTRTAHRGEIPGGGQLFITIAMPLDPAIGYAMVVFFFEDRLHHEYYSYVWLGLEVGGIKLNKGGTHAHMRSCTLGNPVSQQNHKKNQEKTEMAIRKKNTGTSAMFQCVHAYMRTCSKKSQPKRYQGKKGGNFGGHNVCSPPL
jgi:hypothetical protein